MNSPGLSLTPLAPPDNCTSDARHDVDLVSSILLFSSKQPSDWVCVARVSRTWRQAVIGCVSRLTELDVRHNECGRRTSYPQLPDIRRMMTYFGTYTRSLRTLTADCIGLCMDIVQSNPRLESLRCPCSIDKIRHDSFHRLYDSLEFGIQSDETPESTLATEIAVLREVARCCPLLRSLDARVSTQAFAALHDDRTEPLFPHLTSFAGLTLHPLTDVELFEKHLPTGQIETLAVDIVKQQIDWADLNDLLRECSSSLKSLSLGDYKPIGEGDFMFTLYAEEMHYIEGLLFDELNLPALETLNIRHAYPVFFDLDHRARFPRLREIQVDTRCSSSWSFSELDLFLCQPNMETIVMDSMCFGARHNFPQVDPLEIENPYSQALRSVTLVVEKLPQDSGDISVVTAYLVHVAVRAPLLRRINVDVPLYGTWSRRPGESNQMVLENQHAPASAEHEFEWREVQGLDRHATLSKFRVQFGYSGPVYFQL